MSTCPVGRDGSGFMEYRPMDSPTKVTKAGASRRSLGLKWAEFVRCDARLGMQTVRWADTVQPKPVGGSLWKMPRRCADGTGRVRLFDDSRATSVCGGCGYCLDLCRRSISLDTSARRRCSPSSDRWRIDSMRATTKSQRICDVD